MQQDGTLDDLIHMYGKDILHFIRFYTRSNHDAEDLTQEVFVRAFKSMNSFRQDCELKTWLLKIAINVCRNHSRWQKRHPSILLDNIPLIQKTPSAEDEVVHKAERDDIIHQVCELPVKLKEVVLLHYFEDRSVAEIARILGILESTVKVRLHRARNRIKQQKEGLSDEERRDPRGLTELAPHR